jgi:hypothetical protein
MPVEPISPSVHRDTWLQTLSLTISLDCLSVLLNSHPMVANLDIPSAKIENGIRESCLLSALDYLKT